MNIGFEDGEFGSVANGVTQTSIHRSSLPNLDFLVHIVANLQDVKSTVDRCDRDLSDRTLDDGVRAATLEHRIRLLARYDQIIAELADRLRVPKARRVSLLASPDLPSRAVHKERA